jgi:hypothetical protein
VERKPQVDAGRTVQNKKGYLQTSTVLSNFHYQLACEFVWLVHQSSVLTQMSLINLVQK